jgi:hypothetical protein
MVGGAPCVAGIRSDSISTGDAQLARERILDTRIMPQRRPTTDAAAPPPPLISNRPFIVSMSCRERSVEGTD